MPIILTPDSLTTLVSTDRATQNATLAALNATSPAQLTSLLSAATGAIQRYCKRAFFSQTVTEYYDGGGMPYQLIQLREFPVTNIDRIAACPRGVLKFSASQTTFQRATVQTAGTVVRLKTVASGTPATTDIDTATYTTLAAVAAQVNTVSGWTCTVESGFDLYPSADLKQTQGAFDARNSPACLEMYTEELPNVTTGVWGTYGSRGWRCELDSGEVYGHFPQGIQNIRVDYTAGFAVIPDPVQEACVLLAQDLSQTEGINRAIRSERVGPFSYENAAEAPALSKPVRDLLAPYVAHDKLISR